MHWDLFGSRNWLYIILIGFVVGLLARALKPGRDSMGIIFTTLLGIAGALFSGWVGQTMGWLVRGMQSTEVQIYRDDRPAAQAD